MQAAGFKRGLACCIMTVLSPSKVTSTSMSFFMGPILLAARKPCPPQHSRHACSISTRCHVAPAFRPLLMTWICFPSSGRFLMYSACTAMQLSGDADLSFHVLKAPCTQRMLHGNASTPSTELRRPRKVT